MSKPDKEIEKQKQLAMDFINKLTGELIAEANYQKIKLVVAASLPNGTFVTRKTDCFKSVSEVIGMWEGAKFQEMTSLWSMNNLSHRSLGTKLEG